MIFFGLLLLWNSTVDGVVRTTFDLQLIDQRRIVTAKLALNYLDENRFSIHVSKAPTGTLLTYWATPTQNIISFPKQKETFVGNAEIPIALFANGPELSRKEWLDLLRAGDNRTVGSWKLHQVDGWRSLHDEPITFRIRWREKASLVKNRVRRRVFEPDMSRFKTVKSLEDLLGFVWTED